MLWLAVDEDGTEWIYEYKPERLASEWNFGGSYNIIPKGSIQKLIGRSLTWNDEPVELKE